MFFLWANERRKHRYAMSLPQADEARLTLLMTAARSGRTDRAPPAPHLPQ
jgi:hypothetical protein